MFKKVFLTLLFSAFLTTSSFAGILDATITVGGTSKSFSYGSVQNMVDSATDTFLNENFTYTGTETVSANLNYRGMPVYLDYGSGSNDLRLRIPATGLDITFTGNSRDEAQDSLVKWFEGSGSTELTKVMQALAKETANDPIAGNPNSLQANIVEQDFYDGTSIGSATTEISAEETKTEEGTVTAAGGAARASTDNYFSIGASYYVMGQGGLKSQRVTIPFKYTIVSDSNPLRKYVIKIPVSQVTVDGAKSYTLGLGVAASFPVKPNWIVTPSFTYGAGGSVDLGSAAQMTAYSLTSQYTWGGKIKYTLGNMIGQYKTIPFKYGDYDIDPDIQNTVLRNGILATIPVGPKEKNRSVQLFVVDTRYSGTDLFIDQYNDIGAAYGFTKKFKVGVTYITSSRSNGYGLNFGYKF